MLSERAMLIRDLKEKLDECNVRIIKLESIAIERDGQIADLQIEVKVLRKIINEVL